MAAGARRSGAGVADRGGRVVVALVVGRRAAGAADGVGCGGAGGVAVGGGGADVACGCGVCVQGGEDAGGELAHAAEDGGEDLHEGAEGGFGEGLRGEAGGFVEGEEGGAQGGRVDQREGGQVRDVVAEAGCGGALEEGEGEGGGGGKVRGCGGDGEEGGGGEGGGWGQGDGFGFDEVREFEDDGFEVEVWQVGGGGGRPAGVGDRAPCVDFAGLRVLCNLWRKLGGSISVFWGSFVGF